MWQGILSNKKFKANKKAEFSAFLFKHMIVKVLQQCNQPNGIRIF